VFLRRSATGSVVDVLRGPFLRSIIFILYPLTLNWSFNWLIQNLNDRWYFGKIQSWNQNYYKPNVCLCSPNSLVWLQPGFWRDIGQAATRFCIPFIVINLM
jgi:hypothetical protein